MSLLYKCSGMKKEQVVLQKKQQRPPYVDYYLDIRMTGKGDNNKLEAT